jgi:hypothetical protein
MPIRRETATISQQQHALPIAMANRLAARALAAVAAILLPYLWLGAASAADAGPPTVPLVGCRADGEMGASKSAPAQSLAETPDPRTAALIAFYGAAHGPGVYAPKGWYCLTWEGSNGTMLVVTPRRIPPPYFPLPVLAGPAVMIQSSDTGSSGRFHVAVVAAQVFPVVGAEFVARIRDEHLIPDSSFDTEPYPDDRLQYLSDRLVEFVTSPNHTGLGTEGLFEMSDLPIRGLIILNLQDEVNSLTELRVRLPAGLNSVAAAIIQLETSCLQLHGRCRGFSDNGTERRPASVQRN